jgi:hypothetical protein
VESGSRLEGHLRPRLSDGLGTDSTDSRPGLDLRSKVTDSADLEESVDLVRRYSSQVVDSDLLVGCKEERSSKRCVSSIVSSS